MVRRSVRHGRSEIAARFASWNCSAPCQAVRREVDYAYCRTRLRAPLSITSEAKIHRWPEWIRSAAFRFTRTVAAEDIQSFKQRPVTLKSLACFTTGYSLCAADLAPESVSHNSRICGARARDRRKRRHFQRGERRSAASSAGKGSRPHRPHIRIGDQTAYRCSQHAGCHRLEKASSFIQITSVLSAGTCQHDLVAETLCWSPPCSAMRICLTSWAFGLHADAPSPLTTIDRATIRQFY